MINACNSATALVLRSHWLYATCNETAAILALFGLGLVMTHDDDDDGDFGNYGDDDDDSGDDDVLRWATLPPYSLLVLGSRRGEAGEDLDT